MPHIAVIIGGGPIDPEAVESIVGIPDLVVIAADSGLDHAVAAGLAPTLLVGDLDSISATGRMWAYANGTDIRESPTDKDQTDTELALQAALDVPGVGNLVVLGGDDITDRRPDHFLGTLLALGHPTMAAFGAVTANLGGAWYTVVHPGKPATLPIAAGRTFSVLALHGLAQGVDVRGAAWELHGADLGPGEARGVSNIAKEDTVEISTTSGVVTVVVP
ncbi:MAG: thiamine diphosphokinase [Ilumatobacteraceae bacterium]